MGKESLENTAHWSQSIEDDERNKFFEKINKQ